jgi:hypothetical protein
MTALGEMLDCQTETVLPFSRTLIGRQKEISTVLSHIRNRKSLHIYGAPGSGKSAIFDWLYDNWKELEVKRIAVYCRSSRTLRETLLNICCVLMRHFGQMDSVDKFGKTTQIKRFDDARGLNIMALKKMTLDYIGRDSFFIMLDHLENVTPRMNAFLVPLYEKAQVISASRQSWELTDYAFKGKLDYHSLYLIPKLRVDNLKKKDAFVLMEYLYNSINTEAVNKQQMFNDIFNVTAGNPGMIKEIFERSQKPEYFKEGRLNLKLILLDSRIDEIKI